MNIKIAKSAVKFLKRLDVPARERIVNGINKLPCGDIKRLKGYFNYYRLRIGDFRVIYTFEDGDIVVLSVLPRGEVYKHI